MVFSYSNFYDLPYEAPMNFTDGAWVFRFRLEKYAVHASFYVLADSLKVQRPDGQDYGITVYGENNRPVEKAYLYQAYSLSSQKQDRKLLHGRQKALIQKELQLYPDNYEAQLRLVANSMVQATPAEKATWLAKGNNIVAQKFEAGMPSMETLNLVTMGYLILGENSRLDSIRSVAMEKYPHSEVGEELLLPVLQERYGDTPALVNAINRELRFEDAANHAGFQGYHEYLFHYHAAKGEGKQALEQARAAMGKENSPYFPVFLETVASTLVGYGTEPDSALRYARLAIGMVDSFPVGLVRFFPQYGYIRSFATEEAKTKERRKREAGLLTIVAQAYLQKGEATSAAKTADSAYLLGTRDTSVLYRLSRLLMDTHQPEKAFDCYRQLYFLNAKDAGIVRLAERAMEEWKGNPDRWADTLANWTGKRKAAKLQEIKSLALNKKGPSLEGILDMDGNPLSADSLRGKVVVIDFWATWCVPCMQEMPYLDKVYGKYAKNGDVVFLVVNSGSNNSIKDAQQWYGRKKYRFPVYFHSDPNVGELFGFNVIPALFVIDQAGKLQYKTIGFEGPIVEEDLDLKIAYLLSLKDK